MILTRLTENPEQRNKPRSSLRYVLLFCLLVGIAMTGWLWFLLWLGWKLIAAAASLW